MVRPTHLRLESADEHGARLVGLAEIIISRHTRLNAGQTRRIAGGLPKLIDPLPQNVHQAIRLQTRLDLIRVRHGKQYLRDFAVLGVAAAYFRHRRAKETEPVQRVFDLQL